VIRKKKDDFEKKNQAVPYRKCNHQRKYKAANGSEVTIYCTKNGNILHAHD
jgi:hypothetical protein